VEEAAMNINTHKVIPLDHAAFMFHIGRKPGFWEGWR